MKINPWKAMFSKGTFAEESQYISRLIHAYSVLICTESPKSITKTHLPVYNQEKRGWGALIEVSEMAIKNHAHLLQFMFRVIPDC